MSKRLGYWAFFLIGCYLVIGFICRMFCKAIFVLFYPVILISMTMVNLMDEDLPKTFAEFFKPWAYGSCKLLQMDLINKFDFSLGIILDSLLGITLIFFSPITIPIILYRLGKKEFNEFKLKREYQKRQVLLESNSQDE